MALVAPAVASGCTCISSGVSLKHTLAGAARGKAGSLGKENNSVCLSDALGEAEVITNSGVTWKCAALRRQQASHMPDLIPLSSPSNLRAPAGPVGGLDGCTVALITSDGMYRCWCFLCSGQFMFHSSLQGCGDSWETGKPSFIFREKTAELQVSKPLVWWNYRFKS